MNIRIIGLGNVLMSDDGFGPYVARVLEAHYEFPASVQVIDAGTPGLDLTPCLMDADVVIFVDTVQAAGEPGEIRTYGLKELLASAAEPGLTPHDPGVRDALLTLAAAGTGPSQGQLIGVIPEWVATGVELSPALRRAIAPVVALVITDLERCGARPRLRIQPRQPDTWWERPNVREVREVRAGRAGRV